eukprot:g1654.t1 g1654   contig10:2519764-2521807(-)
MALRQRGQRPSESSNEGSVGGRHSPYHGGGNANVYVGGASGGMANAPISSSGSRGNGGFVMNPNPYYGQPSPGGHLHDTTTPVSTPRAGVVGAGMTHHAQHPQRHATPATVAPAGGYGGSLYGGGYSTPHGIVAGEMTQYAQTAPVGRYPRNSSMDSSSSASGGGGGMASPVVGRSLNYDNSGYGGYGAATTASSGGGAAYGGGYNSNNNTYGSSTNAVISSSATNPYQKKNSSGFTTSHILLSLAALSFIILCGTTIYFRSTMMQAQEELDFANEYMIKLKKKQERGPRQRGNENGGGDGGESLSMTKQSLLKQIDTTHNELETAVEDVEKFRAVIDGKEELDSVMVKREGALWKRIELLEERIQRESLREAVEWFGEGLYRVEIELEYPQMTEGTDPPSWPLIRKKITIETAPLKEMPHSVNLFLQQVHHHLWDGTSVVKNPKHIMQFGPWLADGNEVDHFDQFLERGLDKVSFQEYSTSSPHIQWSVGFAGRPGGPDFYINKIDNSVLHGPGGSTAEHDLHNEADPCFGKVVEGTEVVNEIDRIPVDADKGYVMLHPVKVVSAKITTERKVEEDAIPLPEVKWDQEQGRWV